MIASALGLLVVLSGACAKSASKAAEPAGHPSSPPVSTAGPSPTTWLVVLRVAGDPAGVQDDADALAPVLGDAIQVAPGSCFTGLPARFGADRYILGATGTSKEDVDSLASKAQIDPLFEGPVQVVCVD